MWSSVAGICPWAWEDPKNEPPRSPRKAIRGEAQSKGLSSLETRIAGAKVGEELIAQGAEDFEKEWREKYGVW